MDINQLLEKKITLYESIMKKIEKTDEINNILKQIKQIDTQINNDPSLLFQKIMEIKL